MTLFFWIAIIGAILYLASVIKHYIKYKKLEPKNVVVLTEDNKGIRNICGVFLYFMIITGGLTFGTMFREGIFFTVESIKIILTFVFFIVLYIPLSSKTKVSNIGIFRNFNLITWDKIIKVEYMTIDANKNQKVRITYNNNYNRPMVIEIAFKKKLNELEALKNMVAEYRFPKKQSKKSNNGKEVK